MRVLITAGGTFEKIDSVRNIENTSTGRLGMLIADAFDDDLEIDYVHGLKALLPKRKVNLYPIENVKALDNIMQQLLDTYQYDAVIHAMAVSDYYIQSVTTFADLSKTLKNQDEASIMTLLEKYPEKINREHKLSSDYDNISVLMKKAPKIIKMIKEKQPQVLCIGFKLLDNVSFETLRDVGYNLLLKNKCDYVLANDLQNIYGDKHIGHLIDAQGNIETYDTKQEIAQAIKGKVMKI